jgi:hypothetical protein
MLRGTKAAQTQRAARKRKLERATALPRRDTCKPHRSRRLARPTTQRQQVARGRGGHFESCTPPRGPGLAVGELAHREAVKLQKHQCEYEPCPSIRRPVPHLTTHPQVGLRGWTHLGMKSCRFKFSIEIHNVSAACRCTRRSGCMLQYQILSV